MYRNLAIGEQIVSKYYLKRSKESLEAERTHRDNIKKSLQRRLEAARSQGNEQLVQMLEAEAEMLK